MSLVIENKVKKIVRRLRCDCGHEMVWTHHNRSPEGTPKFPMHHIHKCIECNAEVLIPDHCYPEVVEQEIDSEGNVVNEAVADWPAGATRAWAASIYSRMM